ncbi:MAG: class I SAM-dependent methyltransferase [Bacteroidota bacterium]
MNDTATQNHWENIYATTQPAEVSWTQTVPKTSMDFIHSFGVDKQAAIIDIGGGDSKLADYLLREGFKNITVLDISANALKRAKKRLGKNANKITWIVTDINEFDPGRHYDVWHDRATFHFLTTESQVSHYLAVATKALTSNGFITIGTFSENGPEKCSGLPVKQYSETSLGNQLTAHFMKIKCITEDHITPFKTRQHFLFCSFKKKNSFEGH